MVDAISQTEPTSTSSTRPRPSLLVSDKDQKQDNGVQIPTTTTRKPRGKLVPSRYLSPSHSSSSSTTTTTTTTTTATSTTSSSSTVSGRNRYPSPLLSRSTNANPHHTLPQTPLPTSKFQSFSNPKRSSSVDRRRPVSNPRQVVPELSKPATNVAAGQSEMSAATKMLMTSTRSLSVSFQGEAFSLPISKTKAVAQNGGRKSTPERRKPTPVRDQGENSRPNLLDHQQRWPGRNRDANSGRERSHLLLSRSLDCTGCGGGDEGVVGSGLVPVKSLQQSIMKFDSETRRLSLDLFGDGNDKRDVDVSSAIEPSFAGDLTASDNESVSSGSTSGLQEFGGVGKGKSENRGIALSARFWQETNSRLRRLQDPGSPLPTSPSSRNNGVSSKMSQSKRFSCDGPLASPRTMSSSPMRAAMRPASPSKLWASSASSPLRGMCSPLRARPGSVDSSTPSILSFSADLRRGKVGEDRINEAHSLRLLYNRYLQWRFANAQADATFMLQRLNAEKNLWNAWVKVSEIRHSVTLKRIKLLLLRQKLKLTSILKGQIVYLEEWSLLDRDHSSSLEGATEALKASTLRLPVIGKALADVHNLKDAIGSAVDVMQSMASSICSLSTKMEEMNSVVAELVNVTVKERVFLEQCKDFLCTLASMQVTGCSLKTHIIQLHRLPTTRA